MLRLFFISTSDRFTSSRVVRSVPVVSLITLNSSCCSVCCNELAQKVMVTLWDNASVFIPEYADLQVYAKRTQVYKHQPLEY